MQAARVPSDHCLRSCHLKKPWEVTPCHTCHAICTIDTIDTHPARVVFPVDELSLSAAVQHQATLFRCFNKFNRQSATNHGNLRHWRGRTHTGRVPQALQHQTGVRDPIHKRDRTWPYCLRYQAATCGFCCGASCPVPCCWVTRACRSLATICCSCWRPLRSSFSSALICTVEHTAAPMRPSTGPALLGMAKECGAGGDC